MKTKILVFPICLLVFILVGLPLAAAGAQSVEQPQPTPTIDRLAIPTLPSNPTQLDIGKSLYYYNCMPCHGDYGQGLTDEFRGIWVEDHQNCWGRGCHSGRPGEEGFPLPRVIPAVNETAASKALFPTKSNLFTYLKVTHPPQNPGGLKDDEYQALSAFVFVLAGRVEAMPEAETGQPAPGQAGFLEIGLGVVLLGTICVVASFFRWGQR